MNRPGTVQIGFTDAAGKAIAVWANAWHGQFNCKIPPEAAHLNLAYTFPDAGPEPSPPESPDFLARILEWLRDEAGLQAAEVTHVTGDGTDWEGDTEGGFYSSFRVEIEWVNDKGAKRIYGASGSDAESLWTHVVRSWPT